jgi:broad specificity phosphatase PhoE
MITRRAFVLGAAAFAAIRGARADEARIAEARAWPMLREGGLVILMRHASTEPGLGDPRHFRVGDCATQRNLSEAGRAEARRVGERFREERVPVARIYTSPWCRCRETAMLAFGQAEDWEPLSSFFDFPDREAEMTAAVKRRIATYARRKPAGNVVMVTHNVNIAALSRRSVAQSEMVLMRPEGCCDARVVAQLKIG